MSWAWATGADGWQESVVAVPWVGGAGVSGRVSSNAVLRMKVAENAGRRGTGMGGKENSGADAGYCWRRCVQMDGGDADQLRRGLFDC